MPYLMTNPDARASRLAIILGLVTAAIGLFLMLLAAGVFQSGQQSTGQEPRWIGIAIGLIFLLGGFAGVTQMVVGGNTTTGELPKTAPLWLRLSYQLSCLAIVVSLGALATWVALGPGERRFTGSGAFLGEAGGRVAFGIGAAIIWLVLAALAFHKIRRLLGGR